MHQPCSSCQRSPRAHLHLPRTRLPSHIRSSHTPARKLPARFYMPPGEISIVPVRLFSLPQNVDAQLLGKIPRAFPARQPAGPVANARQEVMHFLRILLRSLSQSPPDGLADEEFRFMQARLPGVPAVFLRQLSLASRMDM